MDDVRNYVCTVYGSKPDNSKTGSNIYAVEQRLVPFRT